MSITVHFQDHLAVQGASVTSIWNGDATTVFSYVTDSNDIFSITLSRIISRETKVTFTVTSVINGSDTYIAADNHDEDGDTNGKDITNFAPQSFRLRYCHHAL